jgi:ATP-dependent DNA helicase PIF1
MCSPEQKIAYQAVLDGKNIFLTGPGGCGKSWWIRHVYKTISKRVQVCAMTGCAALLLQCNATTVHSWAGIGLGDPQKAISNAYACKRWKNTDILIIDEISMMSVELFEMLNTLGKTIRKSSHPFGGIQIIFCGDFYQLPPINSPFCFESPLWDTVFDESIVLTTIFRQKDESFQVLMNEIRSGSVSYENNLLLRTRILEGIDCVRLVPTRKSADVINTTQYKELPGKEHVFTMKTTGMAYSIDYLRKNVLCPERLSLKIGCKVMCIANLNESICNGSQGTVVAFTPYPVINFNGFEHTMTPHTWTSDTTSIQQLPLIYAWALTIHKAQGATLERAEIDLGNSVFECGQIYVGLSRLTSLEGLYLTEFNSSKIKSHPKVIEFYKKISS